MEMTIPEVEAKLKDLNAFKLAGVHNAIPEF